MAFQSVGGISAPFAGVGGLDAPIAQALERIAGLQGALERLSDVINSASRGIGTAVVGITQVVDSVDRIAAVLASSAEGTQNFPSSGGGNGGGQGGGNGSTPPDVSIEFDGQELSAAVAAIGYAFYKSISEAMDENQTLAKTLATFNVPGQMGAERQRDLALLQEAARVSALGSRYTAQETAQAMLGAARRSGLTGSKGIEEFADIFPSALTMAEVGQERGLGSIADNLNAAIGYADLAQRYDPRQIAPGLNEILAIAESTRTSLQSVVATIKNGLPAATAAGTNIDQATAAIGYLMSTGLGRSAGDAADRMILGALTTGGPMSGSLAQERAAVAGVVGQSSRQLQDMTAHVRALRELGVTDAAEHLTDLNSRGGVDLGKILADIRSYGAQHTSAELADALHQAFGIQGLPDATLRALQHGSFADFEKTGAGTSGAPAQQAMLAATPLQQFEQSLARLQDIGNLLGTAILPGFTTLETRLLGFLEAVENFPSRHKVVPSALAHAAGGATIGWWVGGPVEAVAGAAAGAFAAYMASVLENGPDWIKAHNLAVAPRPLPAPSEITVNAPLTVTVQGDVLGDYANLSAFLSAWWEKNSGAIGDAVSQQIRRKQTQARRSTMQDYGNAGAYPGGMAMGGL